MPAIIIADTETRAANAALFIRVCAIVLRMKPIYQKAACAVKREIIYAV
jgi:hypothetical protein